MTFLKDNGSLPKTQSTAKHAKKTQKNRRLCFFAFLAVLCVFARKSVSLCSFPLDPRQKTEETARPIRQSVRAHGRNPVPRHYSPEGARRTSQTRLIIRQSFLCYTYGFKGS